MRSRNTMITSAFLFLLVVVMLRFTGGFFEENVVRVVGSIFGGNAESIPLLDFSAMDYSMLNPLNWSFAGVTESVNGWFHDFIDSVMPAAAAAFNAGVIHVSVLGRVEMLEAGMKLTKFSSAV